MYTALFLSPWVLIYALSTMAMNHRAFFQEYYGDKGSTFEVEREFTYEGSIPEGADAQTMAALILTSLDLYGTHNVRGSLEKTLTINRNDPTTPRRITFEPATGKLTIMRREFRTSEFLEHMHRRRGYRNDRFLEDLWAFSVDVFIVVMLLWAGSGLWMWWEMSITRKLGAACLLGSAAVFTFFLFMI